MHAIADTDSLVADGIITLDQAKEIESRAHEAMISLAINSILCFGIIAATAGLIVFLANATAVAILGAALLAAGLLTLARGAALYHMFGNAAALIGAGLLIGGGSFELIDKHEDIAGTLMLIAGAVIAGIAGRALWRGGLTARFVAGSIFLMGIATHLAGAAMIYGMNDISGLPVSLLYLYASGLIALAGWLTNVRFVTALAIVPFAQALQTGTYYWHAVYAFYSPETTLSILQMVALIALCLWWGRRLPERDTRHLRTLSIMAFIVANLCALVGSLWGDIVGETMWGPGRSSYDKFAGDYEAFSAARDAFMATALKISEDIYSILWAVALALIIWWAAMRVNRGLFNTALTFAAIHAYTQLFENMADEPLAWVIGGLSAIPLAWGMWRLNTWLGGRRKLEAKG